MLYLQLDIGGWKFIGQIAGSFPTLLSLCRLAAGAFFVFALSFPPFCCGSHLLRHLLISELLERVRGVRDDLADEDLLVRVPTRSKDRRSVARANRA